MKPNIAAMPNAPKTKRARNGADPLGTNSEIARKLKQYYDGLVAEDIPDRFADLLKQLEDREIDTARSNGE